MKTISDLQAGQHLVRLMREAAESHEPIQIIGELDSAVLISEQHWRKIEQMLHSMSANGKSMQVGSWTSDAYSVIASSRYCNDRHALLRHIGSLTVAERKPLLDAMTSGQTEHDYDRDWVDLDEDYDE